MINENATRHTLSVLVDNASGVLSQVSRLFSRKGYNIESLAVGATDNPEVSRITIEVLADELHDHPDRRNQLPQAASGAFAVKLLAPEHSSIQQGAGPHQGHGAGPAKSATRSFRWQTSSGPSIIDVCRDTLYRSRHRRPESKD